MDQRDLDMIFDWARTDKFATPKEFGELISRTISDNMLPVSEFVLTRIEKDNTRIIYYYIRDDDGKIRFIEESYQTLNYA